MTVEMLSEKIGWAFIIVVCWQAFLSCVILWFMNDLMKRELKDLVKDLLGKEIGRDE